MTIYGKMNEYIFVQKERDVPKIRKLPTSIYILENLPMVGFALKEAENFHYTGKLYGNIEKRTDRVINTFYDRATNRNVSTGVLLSGEKGSGKTLLAKNIAKKLLKDDISTIIVNAPHCGTAFNEFMATFEEPVCVIFDEYEKVYAEKEAQEKLLTLFDGLFQSKMLFILTANRKGLIDDNMINRPGRIYYAYDYNGLDMDFVREYLEDNLENKEMISQFIDYSKNMISTLNFDMLKAMTEELNRYGETMKEVVENLNISSHSLKKRYQVLSSDFAKFPRDIEKDYVDFKSDDLKIEKTDDMINDGNYVNIFQDNSMYLRVDVKYKDDDGTWKKDTSYVYFNGNDIKEVKNGVIVIKTDEFTLTLAEKIMEPTKSYWDFAY